MKNIIRHILSHIYADTLLNRLLITASLCFIAIFMLSPHVSANTCLLYTSPVSTTQVFKVMYPRRELSYSTIMLTMAKLAKKGILDQERTGDKKTDPFIYRTNITREEMGISLLNSVSRQVLGKPLHEGIAFLCGTCLLYTSFLYS